MRILSTAASTALVVVALSAPAAVPAARLPSPVSSASVSLAQPVAAQVGPAQITANPPANVAQARTAQVSPQVGSVSVAPRGVFAWPLSPRPAVHRRFEPPRAQWSSGHRGVDLLAVVAQPVLSAGDGVVAFSGVIAGRGVITVRHSGGLRTTYEPVDERLASGTLVHRSTRIGIISPTPGHCVPRHCLHWGAISGKTYRDPLSLLGFGRPILLPLG